MSLLELNSKKENKTGFIVPENYFDDFSERFFEKISEEKIKIIPFYKKTKNILIAVAAVFILALSLPIYNYFLDTSQPLEDNSLENYLVYQTNITQYDLIVEIEPNDLTIQDDLMISDKADIENHFLQQENLEQLIIE